MIFVFDHDFKPSHCGISTSLAQRKLGFGTVVHNHLAAHAPFDITLTPQLGGHLRFRRLDRHVLANHHPGRVCSKTLNAY